jgi:hypothetical protein
LFVGDFAAGFNFDGNSGHKGVSWHDEGDPTM